MYILPLLACIPELIPSLMGERTTISHDALLQVCCAIRSLVVRQDSQTAFRTKRKKGKGKGKGKASAGKENTVQDFAGGASQLLESYLFPNLKVVARIIDNFKIPTFGILGSTHTTPFSVYDTMDPQQRVDEIQRLRKVAYLHAKDYVLSDILFEALCSRQVKFRIIFQTPFMLISY
jgi:hypothetical protein